VLHREILNRAQLNLLPLLKEFRRSYYLVGGTAIALQIGHRRSIDFDLFTLRTIKPKSIMDKFHAHDLVPMVTRRVDDQFNLIANQFKFTFFQYPFPIRTSIIVEGCIQMPDVLTLAAMKAYALGRRSKWKDYVDLFYILTHVHTLDEITVKARIIFGDLFSEKQFRARLMYFDDIDYTEEIEYLSGNPGVDEIKDALREMSIKI